VATLAGPHSRPRPVAAGTYDWVPEGAVRDWYFRLLLLLAPIQSVLLTPVQGTTPAFLLTLMAGGVLFGADPRWGRVLAFYVGFALLYALFLALGLSGYTIDEPDMSRLIVIREVYVYGRLKQTHLTQGLYLMAALLFCWLVYTYWQEAFLKWAFFGILLIAAYGFYEFVFYAIFHQNGDFLSNRNFGDLDTAAAGAAGEADFATGSMLQQSNIFGPGFMRLKSLVGEPSMYALTVAPFAVYAFARRWWAIFGLLTLSLFLSTSTTGLIGMGVGLSYVQIRQRREFVLYIGAFLFVAVLLYFTADPIREAADRVLFDKLGSSSGVDRLTTMMNHAAVVVDGNPIRALFGLGFGTVRSTDMATNLLANVGIVGFLGYSALILGPCLLIRRAPDREAIVAALLGIWFMEMLTVSEYAYLPPWFMVALGYARAGETR
jgi:hypothetical protein